MAEPKSPNEIDRYVGLRLKEARLEKKLSQHKLADLSKVTFQQIQKYENGTNRVSASRLHEFAELLDRSIAYFFPDVSIKVKSDGLETQEDAAEIKAEIIQRVESLNNVQSLKTLRRLIQRTAELE